MIRDKSPAIPATDGAIDIAQSTAPVCSLNFLSELTIRIASMADHRNVDIPSGVIDAINDPIVSDSNSPKILVTLKSNNAGRSGTRCQSLDALQYAARNGRVKFLEFLPC